MSEPEPRSEPPPSRGATAAAGGGEIETGGESEPGSERDPPRGGARERLRRLVRTVRPRPFELFALAGALATLLFLNWTGALRLGWRSIAFIGSSVFVTLPIYLAVGVLAQIVAHAARRESIRGYLRQIATRGWLATWGRLWLAGTAVIYAFIWLKVSVPLVRAELFDPELWRLDRRLHFGISPTILAVELADGTVLARFLDLWYSNFLTTVQLGFAYVTASVRADARRNFMLASGLVWILGAWFYLAVPALGPCYATPELREPIRDEMPRAIGAQDFLFAHYGKMISSQGRFLTSFNPSLGVAAMPSLHVAVHWLFALWARRYERRLFLPLVIATGLTFFGSLVTTWHYAVDGYAGMLLAWLAIRLADRFEPVAEEGKTVPS